jgi:hypothetical protein
MMTVARYLPGCSVTRAVQLRAPARVTQFGAPFARENTPCLVAGPANATDKPFAALDIERLVDPASGIRTRNFTIEVVAEEANTWPPLGITG